MQLVNGNFERWQVLVVEDQEDHNCGFWDVIIDECQRPMLHLTCSEGFSMYVAKLFDFESPFFGNSQCLPLGK